MDLSVFLHLVIIEICKNKGGGINPLDNIEILGRDADLVVMVDCQIPADDLVVHFF